VYLGEDLKPYRDLYEIKSGDKDEAWQRLIKLCRVLNETPVDQLAEQIEPLLDVDGVLWFLALDISLINQDGYWVRGSDYSLYLDPHGKFHVIPHDMNESFSVGMGPPMGRGQRRGPSPAPGGFGPGGPGFGGPPPGTGRGGPPMGGGGSVDLDPLMGLDEANRPLRSKLLQVPEYRRKYLAHVGKIAKDDLSWEKLGPIVAQVRSVIEPLVKLDTRKLSSTDDFISSTSDRGSEASEGPQSNSLRLFAEQRRAYLLSHPEVNAALEQD
jgi:hypothetical protein